MLPGLPLVFLMRIILVSLSVFVAASPFFLFFNFPPLVDFPKQLLAFFVVSLFGFFIVGKLKPILYYSSILLFFVVFFSWFLVASYLSFGGVSTSFWHVFLVGFFGGLCLVVAPSARAILGEARVNLFLVSVLFVSGVWVSIFGLLRFYGLAKFIVPWLEVDGSRLLGPWGQPNLAGLSILLGLISLVSLLFLIGKRFWVLFSVFSIIFIYSGVMTGSRAWLVLFFGYLILLFFSGIMQKGSDLWRGGSNRKVALFLFSMFCIVYPTSKIVDDYIAEPLQDRGVLDRQSASQMLERYQDFSGKARIHEWKKVRYYFDIADNIWIGYGPGRYGVFSNQVTVLNNAEGHNAKYWDNAHNIFVMALVEGGVVGLVLVGVGLLGVVFFVVKNILRGERLFYCYVMAVLLAQNLVEFSFWYMPFLFVFLTFVGLCFRVKSIKFSNVWVPRFLFLLCVFVFLPSIVVVVKDYVDITKYYYYSFYDEENDVRRDHLALDLSKGNIFIGYAAWETDILANQPPSSGWKTQLGSVSELWRWQPVQSFSLRRATLLSALDDPGACDALATTTLLYPDTLPKINEELRFFRTIRGDEYPIDKYMSCALDGMAPWLEHT